MSRYLLSFQKTKTIFPSIEFQKWRSSFVFWDYIGALKLFPWALKLSSVATDGKSEYGLKREKIGPTFSSFNATNAKSQKQIAMVIAPWWKFFDIFISLQEHFIYG